MKKDISSASGFAHAPVDRRMTIERRQFSYADCIPERRSGIDRRGLCPASYHDGAALGQSINPKWEYCH